MNIEKSIALCVLIGFVALVSSVSLASMNADQERTKQIELCVNAGGSFISGYPTECTIRGGA